jgi:hypothetical protein
MGALPHCIGHDSVHAGHGAYHRDAAEDTKKGLCTGCQSCSAKYLSKCFDVENRYIAVHFRYCGAQGGYQRQRIAYGPDYKCHG